MSSLENVEVAVGFPVLQLRFIDVGPSGLSCQLGYFETPRFMRERFQRTWNFANGSIK